MRVKIVSRIFEPEPSAASFRLGVLADVLAEQGHEVEVLTVRAPKSLQKNTRDIAKGYRVRRAPVLRDRAGYVRGYLQYMSFDLPLFFRVLFGRKSDVIVVEPPPTTGFFTRIAAAMRRTPYVYYAADIWADGASQTGAPSWMVRAVGRIEKFAMRGAKTVLSVSDALTRRLSEIGVAQNVLMVGNGVDWRPFYTGSEADEEYVRKAPPELIYAGTASEWHGSTLFIEALPQVLAEYPDVRVRFIGGGSEFEKVEKLAEQLGISQSVTIEPFQSPSKLAPTLRGASVALASILPGNGNEFTFPTKLYASTLSGTPAIFAGVGPAVEFVQTEVGGKPLGINVQLDPSEVAQAILYVLNQGDDVQHRRQVAQWGVQNVSLSAVAERIRKELEGIVRS